MADYKEIGVIPYYYKNNSYRFVLVTSRKKPSSWIFPKGQPEDERTDREIAINEAFEEAGVIGTIQGKAIKVTVQEKNRLVLYKLYPFKISRICQMWPERKLRRRCFLRPENALKELRRKPYAQALSLFLDERR
ncbi:MAG: NUDIX domain-containing protein [Spirochaetales bacterium]|nr:NUDIX domain-containing protein [Spirochaetales bacterium]